LNRQLRNYAYADARTFLYPQLSHNTSRLPLLINDNSPNGSQGGGVMLLLPCFREVYAMTRHDTWGLVCIRWVSLANGRSVTIKGLFPLRLRVALRGDR